ncbi:MAG: hypothetical protein RR572_04885 [Raoultibacter sp.]
MGRVFQPKRCAAGACALLFAVALFVGMCACVAPSGNAASDAARSAASTPQPVPAQEQAYQFASQEKFDQHYKKHGREFGNISQDEYLQKANDLIVSNAPTLKTKKEKTDGDTCYYDSASNEFLVLSKKGVIRTFFHPNDGIDYFNRQ